MLDLMSPCIYFMTGTLYLLTPFTHFPHRSTPPLPVVIFLHVSFKGFTMINWISFSFFKYVHQVQYLRLKWTLYFLTDSVSEESTFLFFFNIHNKKS